jgi:multicomponent Na+:H+ antiporter subunit C
MEQVQGLWVYGVVVLLMMIGLYTVISRDNLVKKIMGLNIFQVSVIMFYVSLGKVDGATAPIFQDLGEEHADDHGEGHGDAGHDALEQVPASAEGEHEAHTEPHDAHASLAPEGPEFSNPLPHVLMLTAIVVGIATTALGLALVVRIREAYGTVEEDELLVLDRRDP